VVRACAHPDLRSRLVAQPLYVIAAGKAAGAMAGAMLLLPDLTFRDVMCVSTHRSAGTPDSVEWYEAAHPVPDQRSVDAGKRALQIAASVTDDALLLLLLSGGASALLAAPLATLTLADKQNAIRLLLHGGADIHALNTVRKHISAIKGGRLAAQCKGHTLTLAISDVIGDDLTVIGSGPGVADSTSWHDAAQCLARADTDDPRLRPVEQLMARGLGGEVEETPKPGAAVLRRADGRVIASRADALRGARAAAEKLGYRVLTVPEPVTGEARLAAREWFANAERLLTEVTGPHCVLSAGETTVRVTGRGKGGRNQEFALAIAEAIAAHGSIAAAASAGTDGIDGPTDAAGAVVDSQTVDRAAELGLAPARYLDENDSYAFFSALGDLIVIGPTDTNVGDIQILLTH
jgi:glycerate 2-kinase